MKKMKYCTASSFVLATLVTTQVLSLIIPVTAQQVPSTVANGILHPKESNFFREGRDKFEKEIRFLLGANRSPLEVPLKVNQEQTQIRKQRSLLDNPQYFPDKKALPSH